MLVNTSTKLCKKLRKGHRGEMDNLTSSTYSVLGESVTPEKKYKLNKLFFLLFRATLAAYMEVPRLGIESE